MTVEDALRAAGWTPWTGGPCPVDEYSYPTVLYANGETDCERAGDYRWEHDPLFDGDNIIAYRPTP